MNNINGISGQVRIMVTLDDIRQDITQLDQELLALLAKRKALSIAVARAKQANPRPIRDHQREQDLLVALIQKGRVLGLDAQYVTRLYHTIIEDSVLSQIGRASCRERV